MKKTILSLILAVAGVMTSHADVARFEEQSNGTWIQKAVIPSTTIFVNEFKFRPTSGTPYTLLKVTTYPVRPPPNGDGGGPHDHRPPTTPMTPQAPQYEWDGFVWIPRFGGGGGGGGSPGGTVEVFKERLNIPMYPPGGSTYIRMGELPSRYFNGIIIQHWDGTRTSNFTNIAGNNYPGTGGCGALNLCAPPKKSDQ